MKHKRSRQLWVITGVGIVGLAVGIGIGFLVSSLTTERPASPSTIEVAKQQIAHPYQNDVVKACWQINNGEVLAAGKYQLDYRSLRFNRQLNRAIITDCSEHDTLLAKDTNGAWKPTRVNITLGNRVNAEWQKACLIEDMTVADDTVRPENSSIDAMNLELCQELPR